jgi:trimethylamine:corrinoid methyltransferase-like protein
MAIQSRIRGIDRAARAAAKGPVQRAWTLGHYTLPPLQPLSEDALSHIHEASLAILQEIGLDLLSPAMRSIAAAQGADVRNDSERVRFPREVVEHHLRQAPARFTIHGRGPGRDLDIGGDAAVFGCVSSAPNSSGLGRERHSGTFDDFRDFVRLGHALNAIRATPPERGYALILPQVRAIGERRRLEALFGDVSRRLTAASREVA